MRASRPAAVVFDLYGTLLDVSSVERACAAYADDPRAFVALWRRKQLEYTWLRGLAEQYVDFWAVTADALRFTCARQALRLGDADLDTLMGAWLDLQPFPDVSPALESLGGMPLAVLSNGSLPMIEAGLRSSGLRDRIRYVLSVDAAGTYKPSPRVYALAAEALGAPLDELLFVTGNGWDAAGARAAGMRACRINRTGEPMDELGFAPDMEVVELRALAAALAAGPTRSAP